MRVRVSAGCRLHFGLLSVQPQQPRQFGGCGVVLDEVRVSVVAEASGDWQATGPCAERALAFAKLTSPQPVAITVEACPPEHVGLGVGTQLGLAVAQATSLAIGEANVPVAELARRVGRGQRSGIGLHGFQHGGWIVDGGKSATSTVPVMLQQSPWPSEWRMVLIRPPASCAWHGETERAAFARPRDAEAATRLTEQLARLLLLALMPAMLEQDFPPFAAALTEYNRLAGRHFAAEQGGEYGSCAVSEIIELLEMWGQVGVGQSSWGPTVFCCVPTPDAAEHLAEKLRGRLSLNTAIQVVRGGPAAQLAIA
jgi:beta-RFAP synthase